jgi:hypothetical protein
MANRPEAIERAARLVAENRIREAIEQGAFDDLPGAGKPLPDIDEPYDEMWWVRKWVQRERLRGAIREDLLAALRERRRGG